MYLKAFYHFYLSTFLLSQTSHGRYVIKIPKGFNFEERVREVEEELGMPLKDRIPIRYGHPK